MTLGKDFSGGCEDAHKTVLVLGLTPVMGGVETFIYNVVANSDLSRIHFEFLVVGDDDPVYAAELRNLCGPDCVHLIPSIRDKGFAGYRALLRFFWEKGGSCDWMHLNMCTATKVLYCFPFARRFGFRVLAHSHNGSSLKSRFHHLCRPLLVRTADEFAACSDVAAEWLFGPKAAKRARIVHNGVDVDRFAFSEDYRDDVRRELRIAVDAFVVGHVGRFAEQKNHSFLIKAFAELKRLVPDAVLLLVGTGELMEDAKNLVKQLGIEDSVVFAGLRDDTYRLYSAMDVFAMSSLYEGLPVVGVEACSSGLKCVYSSTVSRQADILGTADFLALEDGPEAWGGRLCELKDEIGAFDRSQAAAVVKEAGYDIRMVAKDLNALYLGEEVGA